MQNIGSLRSYHVLLKQPGENVFVSTQKYNWTQIHDVLLIDEDSLEQVKFVYLFKAIVLNSHVIMMKPEIKLMNSLARLELSQLSYFVYCCHGAPVHENNRGDTYCRKKRFHTIWS